MALTEATILDRLRPIEDPDLHRSIVDLGFVRDIRIDGGRIRFDLVLTTPACPVKEDLRGACVRAVELLPGVEGVEVNLRAETRGAEMGDRKALASVKNLVAVASGKGGVGKSTTAVNLAAALAREGAAVGVLDADIYGPSVPTMIRVETPPQPMDDQTIRPAQGHGLRFISMAFFMPKERAAILRGPMVSGYVAQFLGRVDWGALDYLVIDYPPGTGDIQLTLSQQAPITGAVVCTTPQEISLVDVRRAVAMFETTRVPVLGVCETMSYFVCDQCGKKHFIFRSGGGRRMAERLGVPFLGEVPLDPLVTEGGDQGRPIVIEAPESPAGRAYREIAGAVAAQLSILNVERGHYLESFSLQWKT